MFDKFYFNGYKSFDRKDDYVIDEIKLVNVLIGKNNSGKSSLLNLLAGACSNHVVLNYNQMKTFDVSYFVSQEIMNEVIRISRISWSEENRVVGSFYRGSVDNSRNLQYKYFEQINGTTFTSSYPQFLGHLRRVLPDRNIRYRLVSAERNIVPEEESFDVELQNNGSGATNLIRKVLTNEEYDEKLIEVELLQSLNYIMGEDANFERIIIQQKDPNNNSLWEVYLQEKDSKRFALSQSGSGLKTIILVLLNLLVIPQLNKNDKFVFGFEELENNLHPALQRRLFNFIYDYAIKNQIYVFLTTHSHVAINLFFDKEESTVYHVTKFDKISDVKKIDNYIDKVEILDDLDVKASDLLQANGIIWVEGPSDRVYIKRWLEIFGGTDVQEGIDFQFAYYGGKNLSHYTADDIDDLINILLTNRNSAIVMDSDKKHRNTKVRETKKRVEKEFTDKRLFSWITKGREIENYLSNTAIENALGLSPIAQCDIYEKFSDYINEYYKNFNSKKVPFAKKVKDSIDSTNVLDLEQKIKKLYKEIKRWNKK